MKEEIVHKYISTACHHDRHEDCRKVCKFCPANCLCRCHNMSVEEALKKAIKDIPHRRRGESISIDINPESDDG